MVDKYKILFYGAGGYAKEYLDKYMNYIIEDFDVVGIVDSNYMHCEVLHGYIIESPEVIKERLFDYICILSINYADEIIWKIENVYNVEKKKCISTDVILSQYISKRFFHKRIDQGVCIEDKEVCLDFLIPNNPELKNEVMQWLHYNMLKEKYEEYLTDRSQSISDKVKISSKKIWFCWLQGLEEAPDIIRACYNSVKIQMYDYEIVLITKENIHRYIEVPKHIEEKYSKGLIRAAHYADYIRCELLAKYGGVWMDATVLLTERIPDAILESELFLFDYNTIYEVNTRRSSNWFIVSKPENKIIVLIRDMLNKYWYDNDEAIDYLFMHMFIRMIFEKNKTEWVNMKHIAVNAVAMQRVLNDVYEREKYEFIKGISFIHKLSYRIKIDYDKDNIYNHIIKEFCGTEK